MNRLTRLVHRAGASMVAAGILGVAAMTGAVLVGLAPSAQAAVLGALTLNPTNGTLGASPALIGASTPAACPAGFGDQAVLKVGPVAGTFFNLAKIASDGDYDKQPFTLAANRSILKAIEPNSMTAGDYRITVTCVSGTLGDHPDQFETVITVEGTNWHVKGGGGPTNTPTTTTLSASPTGTAGLDELVTLTAQVTPPSATGTIQFKAGEGSTAIDLAEPAEVTEGEATASVRGDVLGDGVHQITAIFVPAAGASYGPSTSAPLEYEITDASVRTTTTLVVTPTGSATQHGEVVLTATVTPATAVGKVKFIYRSASTIGNPVQLVQGTATVRTTTLPPGEYALTARFEPTDPAAWEPSDSPEVPYRVITAATPTATPTASATPTNSATPSESPSPTPSESPNPGGGGGGDLALTGSSIPTLVTGGSVLVGTGVGVLLLSRRRRGH
ncbi:Ig-like domain repeat protein [Micromonospora sp. NPDC049523]|uniref:Ig-like domain repeat protein n=1 Tax=Micromonospora sp. NPDC049523 TaxID=3155921 RepID=UPI00343A6FFA